MARLTVASYPAILMPALYEHSDPKKVKIDFSAPIGEAKPSFNNDTNAIPAPYHHHHHSRPGHDGTRDIAAAGSAKGKRVVLLRGLNYHSSHELIVRRLSEEICRMLGRFGQEKRAEGAICRLILIGDRTTRKSWGYGFVELATVEVGLICGVLAHRD
jgi:RNA-binding protein 5/10